ncbi:transcription and mRNA export factor ENY2 [Manduca sexta]|uniref:transcription and mRNA export factor ENY2 n=1 Tax=Manduca sexta TaxID=7130 RepID=UPI001184285D|nr:transcription and mRNA export factor ENY2 [Manduca sexta]
MTFNNDVSTQFKEEFTSADSKRLGEFLLQRLTECGWTDKLEEVYAQILKETKGMNLPESVILGKLNARAAPLIPKSVKREFREKLKAYRGGPRVVSAPNASNQSHPREKPLRVQINIHLMIKKVPET